MVRQCGVFVDGGLSESRLYRPGHWLSCPLAANVGVALLLYRHRSGDSNARSAWICSRNDAVILAAVGVFGTGSAWPDLGVAALMALLAISGAWTVLRQGRGELRVARAP